MTIDVSRRRDRKLVGKYRCFLNGSDVTNFAYYVDPRRGVVRTYAHDEDGSIVADSASGDVLKVELRGRVRLQKRRAVS